MQVVARHVIHRGHPEKKGQIEVLQPGTIFVSTGEELESLLKNGAATEDKNAIKEAKAAAGPGPTGERNASDNAPQPPLPPTTPAPSVMAQPGDVPNVGTGTPNVDNPETDAINSTHAAAPAAARGKPGPKPKHKPAHDAHDDDLI